MRPCLCNFTGITLECMGHLYQGVLQEHSQRLEDARQPQPPCDVRQARVVNPAVLLSCTCDLSVNVWHVGHLSCRLFAAVLS